MDLVAFSSVEGEVGEWKEGRPLKLGKVLDRGREVQARPLLASWSTALGEGGEGG